MIVVWTTLELGWLGKKKVLIRGLLIGKNRDLGNSLRRRKRFRRLGALGLKVLLGEEAEEREGGAGEAFKEIRGTDIMKSV